MKDMAGLMRACDLAVSAAGTTLYELCAAGVPSVSFTMADNQLPCARDMERFAGVLCAGDVRSTPEFTERLLSLLFSLAENLQQRSALSRSMACCHRRKRSGTDRPGAAFIVRYIPIDITESTQQEGSESGNLRAFRKVQVSDMPKTEEQFKKAVAIITARGGSKRIPHKNIRDFCGRPILSYSIRAALESGAFDEVMVSTDDDEIVRVARQWGAAVPFLRSQDTSGIMLPRTMSFWR